MRIFLSFNSRDISFAEAIRAGLSKIAPDVKIFFSPISLGAGFWLPRLAEEITEAEAFLLLIGPKGIGPWQEVEYFTAFDRHVSDKRFALVPVMVAGAEAPGLSFLRTLNWVEAPIVTEDKALHRLLAALKGETVASTTPLWKLVNPYRGLEAMTEANADYFYGRTRETTAALAALADKVGHCPILIGASGIGKSSVAQAGVLSALKSMRWPRTDSTTANSWPQGLQNSRAWVRLTMRPGEAPLEGLAEAVTRLWQLDAKDPEQAALPRKWARALSAGDNTLAELINATQDELKKREGEAPERILLYIDQGEELYTRAAHKDANRFSEVLAEGLGDARLRAFASMRSDYFGRLQGDEPLFKCYEHVDVPPLDSAQLHEVVTAPARALGVAFEDDQTAIRITTAAAAEPGTLPLLSYLLTDLWAGMIRQGDATLRLPAQAIDVGGVLANRAEEFLKGHPDEERSLRRLLTLKLASVPPEGEPVRRQTTDEECTDSEWELARRLAEHPWRLVVVRERAADKRIVAEVAHEALLRAWPRLTEWLRNERYFLIFKGDAERAERRWRDMGGVDAALLTGLDLTRAEEWLSSRSEDLSREVAAFAQRSIAVDRAAKERQLRIQRRLIVAAVVTAVSMAVVGGFAWLQWNEADRERSFALLQRNEADRERSFALLQRNEADRQKQQADDILAGATNIITKLQTRMDSKTKSEATALFQAGATHGDATSMRNVGVSYRDGLGIAQDYAQAREWFEKAAAEGATVAMTDLGGLYDNGHGVAQDYVKAREWYEKAAAEDDATAMRNLGLLYNNGQGVAQDYAKAREWFEKSAAKDNASAMVDLGLLYKNGQGVAQDYAKAREWYEKAAAEGEAGAETTLEQLTVREAAEAGRYAEALQLQEALAVKVEAAEMKRDGKPGAETANALTNEAWYALLARNFTTALTVADRAHALFPSDLMVEINRAHALMFLGRGEEAKSLYLAHKGKPVTDQDNKLWERTIADDFVEFRKAGLSQPMIADVEKLLGISGSRSAVPH
jgi:TPR repeat protein